MASHEEQEFVRRLEEQLRQLKVADYLTQTVMTISQLAWSRLSGEARDLEQARLAIEALRALVPVLKGAVSDGLSRDLQQVVANLQLAYAGAVAQAGAAAAGPSDETGSAEGSAAAGAAAEGESSDETGSPEGSAAARAAAEGESSDEGGSPEASARPGAAAEGAGTAGGVADREQAATEPLPGDEPPAEPVTEP